MPEIWLPYGDVETLVTLQAENLGELLESQASDETREATEALGARLTEVKALVVCDTKPGTFAILKALANAITQTPELKVYAQSPRKVESSVQELRGRVLAPGSRRKLLSGEGGIEFSAPAEFIADGAVVALGTAQPDPLFGIVDTAIAFCLEYVSNSKQLGYHAVGDLGPASFSKTPAYEEVTDLSENFKNTTFVTVVPRGGTPHLLLEDAPFDAVKNGFEQKAAPLARALVVGAGGRGYDDTLSGALRILWSALNCVRPSGEILLLSECGEGLGSTALEMLVTGRLSEDSKRRGNYVEGMEEISYLRKLKEDYDIILLSGLPEFYAKSKLGLALARGSGEAVGKLLAKLGRTSKVNVVIRASDCAISSA